jgi:lipoprotein NlpD
MSKRPIVNHIRLSLIGLIVGLAGCSNFSQPAAPIESGVRPSPAPVKPAPTVRQAPQNDNAVPTPLPAYSPVQPDAPSKAPVPATENKTGNAAGQHESSHVVAPGETLFRIAHNNGLKYQDVAAWNQLPGDYSIKVGQVLRLTPPGQEAKSLPSQAEVPKPALAKMPPPTTAATDGSVKAYPKALKLPYSANAAKTIAAESEGKAPAAPTQPASNAASAVIASEADAATSQPEPKADTSAATAATPAGGWLWPTQGKVLEGFSDKNKGIDIAGKLGQPVVAVANGSVVYSGTGLRGYGKLIIIKHDKTFLTAYAHNSQILVKEGQVVKKGQKIAEMGNTDADQVKLHFEVRRFGKPVDPTQYLDKQT